MKKPTRENTLADRILAKSLQLFNRNGVSVVTNRDVAKALNISSGNLTYHFNKKTDIIDTLVDQMEAEFKVILNRIPNDAENMTIAQADGMLDLMRVVWRYRFFFNSIRYLIQIDPSQRKRFNELKNTLVAFTVDAYEQLVLLKAVKKIAPPNSTRMVVENTWYLWFSLVRLYETVSPGGTTSEQGFYRFSVDHIFSLLEPHYADRVKSGFHEYVQTKLGG